MVKKIPYKEFNGNAISVIPKLIENYRIANMADLMELRVQGYLRNFEKDSGDVVVQNTWGDVKIVRDSIHLKNLNKRSLIREYSLNLDEFSDSAFEEIGTGKDVFYLPKKKKEHFHGKKYCKDSAKNSELWNFVSRTNQRLEEYVDSLYPEMKSRFEIKEGMAWHFYQPKDFTQLRAVVASRIGLSLNADARSDIDSEQCQFVGISLGDMNKKNLEGKIDKKTLYAMNNGLAFEHNGVFYVSTNAKNIKLE